MPHRWSAKEHKTQGLAGRERAEAGTGVGGHDNQTLQSSVELRHSQNSDWGYAGQTPSAHRGQLHLHRWLTNSDFRIETVRTQRSTGRFAAIGGRVRLHIFA